MKVRLQKLIARTGLASRRKADDLIAAGRVAVNGRVAVPGETADPEIDRITVDGAPLGAPTGKVYLLLNKPIGYVTSARDPQGRPVVTELVESVSARLFPIGRLDLNTEGLLLMTNDGELAHLLMHPRHQVEKTYLVRIRGRLDEKDRNLLQEGILLEDGKTAPARVGHVRTGGSHTWFHLTIREGRNRQVRRMCEALGLQVSRLKRIGVGFLDLGDLPPGRFRHLSSEEVDRLKKL